VAVSWQDVDQVEQEAMLTRLGKMLEYLDSSEQAEFQLRLDADRLQRRDRGPPWAKRRRQQSRCRIP
jgi:hypothetical protein